MAETAIFFLNKFFCFLHRLHWLLYILLSLFRNLLLLEVEGGGSTLNWAVESHIWVCKRLVIKTTRVGWTKMNWWTAGVAGCFELLKGVKRAQWIWPGFYNFIIHMVGFFWDKVFGFLVCWSNGGIIIDGIITTCVVCGLFVKKEVCVAKFRSPSFLRPIFFMFRKGKKKKKGKEK